MVPDVGRRQRALNARRRNVNDGHFQLTVYEASLVEFIRHNRIFAAQDSALLAKN